MLALNENYRILIVEDNPGDITIIEDFLHDQIKSLHTSISTSFKEAKNILSQAEDDFDVILLDLSLPDKNGVELIDETIKISRDIPIIVLTGYADLGFGIKTLSLGVSDYILKDELTSISLFKSILYSLERKKNTVSLRESEKKYSNLFHLSPQPMWVFDPISLQFLDVNNAAIHHYGYSLSEFLSISLIDITSKDDKGNQRDSSLKDYHHNYSQGIFKHNKKNGQQIDVDIQSNYLEFNNIRAMVTVIFDITESKRIENELVKSEFQIRNFATYLNKVLEDERTNLAREIHDQLGQQLAGIKYGISSLKKNISGNIEGENKIKGIIVEVDEIMQNLRKIATELRPGILDTLGLAASLEWLVNEFSEKTNIKCEIELDVDQRNFTKEISTCFFRICQEALTNISKHACASEVNVHFLLEEETLFLTIKDNGNGMSLNRQSNPFSMGLLGMKERASIIGGHLEIKSEEGKGTALKVSVIL